MPRITLQPAGDHRDYDDPISGRALAEDISPGLARNAVGMTVDGTLCDLATVLDRDCSVRIVTAMKGEKESDADALMLIRHSCAHVMAEAIQRVVPGVQLVYGPPLETGFYYDMAMPDDRPISSEDFAAIEAEMTAIIKEDRPFTRYELPIEDGMTKLRGEGSKYKLDNAERAVEAGSDALSWYATGERRARDWEDLCRGPHVPSTGRIGAFKMMSDRIASYWKGDAKRAIVSPACTAPRSPIKQAAEASTSTMLEEAKKRDHRVLGKQLRLFHIDDEGRPGPRALDAERRDGAPGTR